MLIAYHVGGYSTVNVTKADDHCKRDAAFICPFDIIRHPSDDIRDRRVDTTRSQEYSKVGQARGARCNQNDVSGHRKNEATPKCFVS